MNELTEDVLNKKWDEILKYANMIKNDTLRKIAFEILTDYKKDYFNKSGGSKKSSHNCYKGGLLEHTLNVTKGSYQIFKLYDNGAIDLDLILFGAIFHDIGKTCEYRDFEDGVKNGKIKYGYTNLLNHSYLGTHIIQNYLDKYDVLDDVFKFQILHMIGCHMRGIFPGGSLNNPQMLEVIIINYADQMDSGLFELSKELKNLKGGETTKRLTFEGRTVMKSVNI